MLQDWQLAESLRTPWHYQSALSVQGLARMVRNRLNMITLAVAALDPDDEVGVEQIALVLMDQLEKIGKTLDDLKAALN